MTWFDETWFDETWFDETWFDETWFDETWSDETWFDETWFDEGILARGIVGRLGRYADSVRKVIRVNKNLQLFFHNKEFLFSAAQKIMALR